jgi:hypothetical protein
MRGNSRLLAAATKQTNQTYVLHANTVSTTIDTSYYNIYYSIVHGRITNEELNLAVGTITTN